MLKEIIKDYKDSFRIAYIYILFVFVSLIAAGFLFGILESTGILEVAFPDYVKSANFGGAATIFLVVLIFLIKRFDEAINQTSSFTIKGNIFDFEGNALEGVNISIDGDNRRTTSDQNGFFTIDVVPNLTEWNITAKYKDQSVSQSVSREAIRKPIRIEFPKVTKKK